MIITAILTIFLIKDGIAYKDCDGLDRFPDYYWREFKGTIPSDALPGGHDTKGKTTYIGQFHIRNQGVHPVVIYPDAKKMVHTGNQLTRQPGKDSKILCTREQHMFKWIPTKVSTIHQLTDYHFVIGGVQFQSNQTIYVGRTKMNDGELLMATVFEFGSNGMDGMHVNRESKSVLKEFEILVYDFKVCVN